MLDWLLAALGLATLLSLADLILVHARATHSLTMECKVLQNAAYAVKLHAIHGNMLSGK